MPATPRTPRVLRPCFITRAALLSQLAEVMRGARLLLDFDDAIKLTDCAPGRRLKISFLADGGESHAVYLHLPAGLERLTREEADELIHQYFEPAGEEGLVAPKSVEPSAGGEVIPFPSPSA